MAKTGTLHHVELNVSDLNKSKRFWGWLLGRMGYSQYQNWKGGTSYRNGSEYIVFVQTEKKHLSQKFHRKRTGINHLAFHVESRKRLEDLKTEISKRKINFLYNDIYPRYDYYAVYFEDPDRIKVELVAP